MTLLEHISLGARAFLARYRDSRSKREALSLLRVSARKGESGGAVGNRPKGVA